ncbi:MAG TPA: hypothetical protein VKE22_07405 [Haliangiales bacterium]|nr:hypothetical protein [Haliangiales bacterium]
MKSTGLALLLVACASGRQHVAEPNDGYGEIFEVRLPASPYQPLASILPQLHMIAGNLCPSTYDIVDRRMVPLLRSAPAFDRTRRTLTPALYPAAEIVATIRCKL